MSKCRTRPQTATSSSSVSGSSSRVTCAEMIAGRRRCVLLDEISTGLDSATTYDVCAYLGHEVRQQNLTSAVVFLQPPPEVFDLFDDVLLLDNGRLIFHGPRGAVPLRRR